MRKNNAHSGKILVNGTPNMLQIGVITLICSELSICKPYYPLLLPLRLTTVGCNLNILSLNNENESQHMVGKC